MTAYGYLGGDPSKLDRDGYAKGDIPAADATGTLQPVAIGTAGEVLTVDTAQAEDVDWLPGGGGGGAVSSVFGRVGAVLAQAGDYTAAQVGADVAGAATTAQANAIAASNKRIVMRQAYVTTGDISPLPNSAGVWAKLAIAELLIPAAIGDYVDITVNGLRAAGNTFMDVGVVTGVGPTIQRYMSSGTGTPAAANEGNPGWYTDPAFISYRGPQGFVVAAGDLDTGNVRFAIVFRTTSSIGTFFSSANYPFYWRSFNYGPVN